MPIDIRWYDTSQHIIWLQFSSPWTWDDFAAINDRSMAFVSSVNHRVCYLVDLTNVRHLPPGLPLSSIYPVLRINHPNSASYVIIGAKPSIHKTLTILLRVMRLTTHIMFVNTPEEGVQMIQSRLAALNSGT
jgi:hypothetical protein